jgi:hypothetical protein
MFGKSPPVLREAVGTERLTKSLDLLRVVVAEKVDLDGNDYGLCPFHEEKTKSFHLFMAKSGRARFHCFGCGAGGDIFNYLKTSDKLGYHEAINKLGELLQREIVSDSKSGPLSVSLPEQPARRFQDQEQDLNPYIAQLREDYDLLLLENEALRVKLNLPDFQPVNELSQDQKIAEWVVGTCLLFGTTPSTAYRIAGLFLQGLEKKS